MRWKTARKIVINCSGEFAVMPLSSTCGANWSALMTGSNSLSLKLEKADCDFLRFCASLRYAKVPLAKLKAIISTDLWSAISIQWYAWEQSNLQTNFFPAICCAATVRVLTG